MKCDINAPFVCSRRFIALLKAGLKAIYRLTQGLKELNIVNLVSISQKQN